MFPTLEAAILGAAVYSRHTCDKEKRAALLKWERVLSEIVAEQDRRGRRDRKLSDRFYSTLPAAGASGSSTTPESGQEIARWADGFLLFLWF